MLRDLHVRNLAVLAEASVDFGAGLNVLSGETGAGKSIVVDSLALLAGGRASAELIRTGADTLTVTGSFTPIGEAWKRVLVEAGVEPAGLEGGGELVVRREVSREGRNRVFVDDQPVTVRLLADLAPHLLAIHGQRDELGLADPELQRGWLDRSGGAEAEPLRARTTAAWERYRAVAERLERATGDERARRDRLETLRFQLGELDAAHLKAGEEGELRAERAVLRHSEAILRGLAGASTDLAEDDGAATERLKRAAASLEEVGEWEPRAAAWARELEDLRIRLDDVALQVSRRAGEVEADPARLEAVEERLAALERLFRKYGDGSQTLLERHAAIAAEIGELDTDEAGRAALERQVAEALAAYRAAAGELSSSRYRWGAALAKAIAKELGDLALPKARLAVDLGTRRRAGSAVLVDGEPVEAGALGWDVVTFTFAPNPGEEPRPLAKIASGGELARVYLALQLAVRGAGRASGATMVFDEVDAGIGGREAAAVGRKLKRLAQGGQILAVTHLPQVASFADHHFRTSKRVADGRTFVSLEALDGDKRVEEVARMLAGKQVTDLSREHARELLESGAAG
ncbi:MAG TPA: DNA repair protein RecN [Thermoanaerobaculia bacterium]|nr:DNA repair protein RecN [Thermoanaerobaculia bacterium]